MKHGLSIPLKHFLSAGGELCRESCRPAETLLAPEAVLRAVLQRGGEDGLEEVIFEV